MRNCQICGSNGKRVTLNDYDSQEMCLFECTDCGHRYVDALNLSQKQLDEYYLNDYRTDDMEYSHDRLDSLAEFVKGLSVDDVLDIGGTDRQLQARLLERGIACDVAGVGFVKRSYQCAVLSHVLEHVYDLNDFFDRIECDLLVIEIPIHLGYTAPISYDYHWQHVNKFRPQDVERLLKQKGYIVRISEQIEDYREYKVWRLAAYHAGR